MSKPRAVGIPGLPASAPLKARPSTSMTEASAGVNDRPQKRGQRYGTGSTDGPELRGKPGAQLHWARWQPATAQRTPPAFNQKASPIVFEALLALPE